MFTPEPKPTTGHTGQTDREVQARRSADVAIYQRPGTPTRTTQAVSWVGWHLLELGGVLFPLGLGATVWDGFYALSLLAALGWVANELRLRRQQRALRARAGAAQDGEVPE
ncbi:MULTISPECIES: hypothetical protein [Amycolatopsis]|uniref:Uncharacterized protein n=1 Tax=Amycolatopsis thermalba TaxID=944492 RepID=A0ABY4NQ34_9PSEU|nr:MULTISPECIES: hypothetical protein [Amycolatopsis]OXM74546.1 hypothetical protein CF166_04280 [Amycolatopsis sp. KNN50.9b]UQS21758.1 hypothetical protein L1857_02420 [Amycolatopsis thermalba]